MAVVSSHMARTVAALLISPLIVGLLFGVYAVIAVPVMLAVTLVVALPLFLVLRRLRWLQWWHACLAGALCGLVFTAFYWFSSPPYHVEYIGVRNALFFVGLGALVGLAFWWTGVFGNVAFPFVPSQFPRSMFLLVPTVAAGIWLHGRLVPHFVEGRVIAVVAQPQASPERSGVVQLRLQSGSLVAARLPMGLHTPSPVGQCFVLSERWSISQTEKLYFLHSPKFGGRSDDC